MQGAEDAANAAMQAPTETGDAIAVRPWDDRGVGSRRKRGKGKEKDPLAAYRRIRKPLPPPEKVIPDRRRELEEEEARREMEDR